MRVMRLDANRRYVLVLCTLQCMFCGQIARMQIISNCCRLYPEQSLEVFDTLLKGTHRLVVFHVLNGMTEKRVILVRNAKLILSSEPAARRGGTSQGNFTEKGA